jgi:hypothetical protein
MFCPRGHRQGRGCYQFPMDPHLTALFGVGRVLTDQVRRAHQSRRKLRVLVHKGYFLSGGPSEAEHYFIKVTNAPPKRAVEVTHIWFETKPPVHVLNPHRPLSARLRLDETFETWILVAEVPDEEGVEYLGRVRLSSGKVVKSRLHKDVPPVGYAVAHRPRGPWRTLAAKTHTRVLLRSRQSSCRLQFRACPRDDDGGAFDAAHTGLDRQAAVDACRFPRRFRRLRRLRRFAGRG